MPSLKMTAQGYTVLELVLVIMVVSILAVMVVPSWKGAETFGPEFEARRVLNDVRFAQAMSLGTGLRHRFVITSSTSYQILNESGSPIILPSGGDTVTLSSGVSFGTLTNLPNSLLAFDAKGTPYVTAVLPGTPLSATAVIPIASTTRTRSVTVLADTGLGAIS